MPKRTWYDGAPIARPSETVPLVVAIDPSKTNLAIAISTVLGDPPLLYEISGKNMDTTVYCSVLRGFLATLFKDCTMASVYVEQMILPSNKKRGEQGTHRSFITVEVLSEVQANIKAFFYDFTKVVPQMINNQDWKKAILPYGYNKRGEKGSKTFLAEENEIYEFYSDDLTDAICLHRYAMNRVPSISLFRGASSAPVTPYNGLICNRHRIPANCVPIQYNDRFTLSDNIHAFVSADDRMGVMRVHSQYIKDEHTQYLETSVCDGELPYVYILIRRVK
jgi:hypothetical protein